MAIQVVYIVVSGVINRKICILYLQYVLVSTM